MGAEGAPTSYRVRIAGQELQVPDLDALLRLAREGQLGAAAEVRGPNSERWIPVSQILAAHSPKRDPWSAWEEADQVDAKSIWEEFAPPPPPARGNGNEVEELPSTAVLPMEVTEDEPTDPGRPIIIAATLPPPTRTAPPSSAPQQTAPPAAARLPDLPRRAIEEVPRRPTGKVIAFPPRATATSRPLVDGPYALDEVEEPVPLRPPPPPIRNAPVLPPDPEPDASVRWWRLATLALVGMLLLGLARWYVLGQARQTFPAPEAGPATPVVPPVATRGSASGASSPYASVEERLRQLLPTDTKEVRLDTALEDALLVELRAMHVDVLRIEAPILTWGGRKNDVPQRAEIHVHLRDDEDNLDWDLGAVGMVVGKYIQRYSLDVQRLDVVFEGGADNPARIAITPESARQLYMERKSLLDFLKTR